uniref:Secreted protein n=1 Tax=Rhipicephalus appendiculatus TaxID=34631 RepID=A0A131YSQ4_RHIAP
MTKFSATNVLAVMVTLDVILLTIENQGPQSALAVPLPGCCGSKPRSKRSASVSGVPLYRPHFQTNNSAHSRHQRHGHGFSTNVTHVGGPKYGRKRSQAPTNGTHRRPTGPRRPRVLLESQV